ncbi:MAG: glycosyltransferase [Chitinophagaceae bacterium]|nr:glycosyltransferase [Chitinophagaceae bacterium]
MEKFFHVIDSADFNPLLFNSIKYSDRDTFQYTVISLSNSGPLKEQVESVGAAFIALDILPNRNYISGFRKLYGLFKKQKPSYVQTHLFKSSLLALSAAKLAKVPVRIFTGHHSHEVPLYNRPLLTWVDGISGRWLANHSIAPSQDMKAIFRRSQKIPEKKIAVIPHGFDLQAWREKALVKTDLRAEFNLEGKIIFGATGRLFWVKNFPLLIRSFAEFAKNNSDSVLLIAGDGGDRGKIAALIAELNMNDRIRLLGKRTDIASVMENFDVFIHPSLAESFGMVYIEAFALGKPTISSKVGIAPDIIVNGKNGLLVDASDGDQLVKAMQDMYQHRSKWTTVSDELKTIADKYDVRKTQPLCDEYYTLWLNKK